jgi:hypothetical protein
MTVLHLVGGLWESESGPRGFRGTGFIFGIPVAASGCPAIGFFWEYPTVARDSNAGSIQLIPIANKLNIPW